MIISSTALWLLQPLGVLFIFVGFILLLPEHWSTEKNLVFRSDRAKIWPYLNNPKKWSEWAHWGSMGIKLKHSEYASIELSGGSKAEGVTYTVKNLDAGRQIKGEIFLVTETSGTQVKWRIEGLCRKNPVTRTYDLVCAHFLGSELKRGLFNLRTLLENAEDRRKSSAS